MACRVAVLMSARASCSSHGSGRLGFSISHVRFDSGRPSRAWQSRLNSYHVEYFIATPLSGSPIRPVYRSNIKSGCKKVKPGGSGHKGSVKDGEGVRAVDRHQELAAQQAYETIPKIWRRRSS